MNPLRHSYPPKPIRLAGATLPMVGHVRMYVCGMTIYDLCHMGHARMMMAFDVVYRWLQVLGYDVTYVRNITDIEDKIIRRAVENNETIGQLTGRFIRAMDEDLAALDRAFPPPKRETPLAMR